MNRTGNQHYTGRLNKPYLLSKSLTLLHLLLNYVYGSPTLFGMAAGYAAGIILNHPFLDGNKRIGFIVAVTFLELNGLTYTASEESVVEKTLALAAGRLKEAGYASWLKENCRKS
jgi:death-on-curing protein